MCKSKETEWNETTDAAGVPCFERKVGDFWVSIDQDGSDDGEWDAYVEVTVRRVRGLELYSKREVIGFSHGHTSREAAQDAADAMLAALVAPFVETARAEGAAAEREACAQIAHERAEMSRLPSGWDAALAEALAIEAAIRARGAEGNER